MYDDMGKQRTKCSQAQLFGGGVSCNHTYRKWWGGLLVAPDVQPKPQRRHANHWLHIWGASQAALVAQMTWEAFQRSADNSQSNACATTCRFHKVRYKLTTFLMIRGTRGLSDGCSWPVILPPRIRSFVVFRDSAQCQRDRSYRNSGGSYALQVTSRGSVRLVPSCHTWGMIQVRMF